jgi:hypothetical protein
MHKTCGNDTPFPQPSGIYNKNPSSVCGSYGIIPCFAIVLLFVNFFNAILILKNRNCQIKVKAMILNIRNALCFIPLISVKKPPKHILIVLIKQRIWQAALLVNLALFSFASCATAPVPDWAASPSAIRTVYPDSSFLAQRGRGATREAAELAAAAEIARFFNSQISAQSGVRMSINQQNGESTESLQTFDEAFVQSQIDLFGIRYAQDAFYNKGEWQTVAYIDRNEAWAVYEPRF